MQFGIKHRSFKKERAEHFRSYLTQDKFDENIIRPITKI